MFVGHYSIAFAVKSEKNRIPLWVLFIAVQFLDYIWATLVLLGIEKLRVIKGFTVIQIGDTYMPRTPLTPKATAVGVWIFYTLFVIAVFFLEKIGRARQINAP